MNDLFAKYRFLLCHRNGTVDICDACPGDDMGYTGELHNIISTILCSDEHCIHPFGSDMCCISIDDDSDMVNGLASKITGLTVYGTALIFGYKGRNGVCGLTDSQNRRMQMELFGRVR